MVSSLIIKSLFIFAISQLTLTQAGYLHVKFIYYDNPYGLKEGGKRCDVWPFHVCDTFFKIEFQQGKFLKHLSTWTWRQSNSVKFRSKLSSSEPNPLVMYFSKLQTSFRYRIEVWDLDNKLDANGHDRIETFTGNLWFDRRHQWKLVKARNNGRSSSLVFNASVQCSPRDENCFSVDSVTTKRTETTTEKLFPSTRSRSSTKFTDPTRSPSTEKFTDPTRSPSTEKFTDPTRSPSTEEFPNPTRSPSRKRMTAPKELSFPQWMLVTMLSVVLISVFAICLFIMKIRKRMRCYPTSSSKLSSGGLGPDNNSQERSDEHENQVYETIDNESCLQTSR